MSSIWTLEGWAEEALEGVYTLKNAGLFQPNFGSNMDKPKMLG